MRILNLHFKDNEIVYTISNQNRPSKIYSLGKIEIPENYIVKGKITDFSALYRFMRKRIRAAKIKIKNVNIVINDMQLFKKRIIIPSYIEEKDFRKFIDANLNNSIIMPVENPKYFYEVIDSTMGEDHQVMLYAMSDDNYLDYQKLFFELGMKIVDYTFESTALVDFDCYLGNDKRYIKKNVLLVDIAEEQMSLTIFEDFSITYTVVADLNTKALKNSVLDDVYNKKSILYKVYFEIEKVVNFYNVSTGKQIDVVLKSTYPLEDKYLQIVSDSLGAKVSRIKNGKVANAETKKYINDESYFKNFGVSTKSKKKRAKLDLKFSRSYNYGFRLYGFFTLAVVMALLLVLSSTNVINTFYSYQSAEKEYNNRQNDFLKISAITQNIAEYKEFEALVDAIYALDKTEIDLAYIIDRISNLRNEDAIISDFNYNELGEIAFTYTDLDVEVLRFIRRLEDEGWILDVAYNELFYTTDAVEVRIVLTLDKSLLTFDKTRGEN